MNIIVGISGGSGAIYAVALLKYLREFGVTTHLVASKMGANVMEQECGVSLAELEGMADYFYDNDNFNAPIASGSAKMDGMVVAPCSMKTLASIANGIADSLLTRAADVTIKEQRKLVLLAREMPLSQIHLENMLSLAKQGVVIMPPAPPFYQHPETISDLVAEVVGRTMDQLGVPNDLVRRWGENDG